MLKRAAQRNSSLFPVLMPVVVSNGKLYGSLILLSINVREKYLAAGDRPKVKKVSSATLVNIPISFFYLRESLKIKVTRLYLFYLRSEYETRTADYRGIYIFNRTTTQKLA